MRSKRGILMVPLLAMVMMAPSCEDKLKTLAHELEVISETNSVVQKAVIAAEKKGLITADEARPVIEVTLKIGLAGKEAVAATKAIAKLDEGSRGNLFEILEPIVEVVDRVIDNEELSGIHNEGTRQELELAFGVIRTALTTARIILEDQ